jgi:hypothetical protein
MPRNAQTGCGAFHLLSEYQELFSKEYNGRRVTMKSLLSRAEVQN